MPIAYVCCTVAGLFKMSAHDIFEGTGTGICVATVQGGAVASLWFVVDAIALAYWAPSWLLRFLFWCWGASEEVEQTKY